MIHWENIKVAIWASYGDLVGVVEHIKSRRGKHGNTGEPNVSTRSTAAYSVSRVNKRPGCSGNLMLLQ
jgi:hypothetical protein